MFWTITWTRKFSEFHSKPFRRGMLWIPFRGKQTLGAPFQSMSQMKKCCLLCLLEQDFVKQIFFMPFSSLPSLGIDSSVNIIMPRNEHFLPRNKGSHSEFLQRNFFLNKIPLPTLNTGGWRQSEEEGERSANAENRHGFPTALHSGHLHHSQWGEIHRIWNAETAPLRIDYKPNFELYSFVFCLHFQDQRLCQKKAVCKISLQTVQILDDSSRE